MSIKFFTLIFLFVLNLSASERIISLSPSITEILFALGVEKKIVATSSYSLYPKEAQTLPIVGDYSRPHLEKILSHSPTLVIGQSYNHTSLEQLQNFHIKTLELNLKTLKGIQDSITALGEELNTQERAKILTTNINNSITKANKAKTPHSVMIVYGLREDLRSANYIAGHDVFFEDIIQACGNTNAYTAASTSQPVLSYENIIAINPDQIIILHSLATEKEADVQRALKNWYSLPTNAAQNKKISIVDEDYLHIPSHRVALTIERLCKEMYYD